MELTLKLPVEYVNAIMEALGNAPYRTSAPIVAVIQMQASAQMVAAAAQANPPNDAN